MSRSDAIAAAADVFIAFRLPCGCARAVCVADGDRSTREWCARKVEDGYRVERRPRADCALLRVECEACAARRRAA